MPLEPMFSITGRTALITGGGSGIGRAIAHGLSDAGAAIVLVGRRQAVLQEALQQRAGAIFAADLIDTEAPASIARFCSREGLSPDILVNAAGINPRQSADHVSPQTWQSTLQLNLTAPFFLAQHLVPAMADRGWGRIINIASLQSARAFADGIAYGASKGGIVQVTRAMAEAWSSRGINANAIAPGFFPTELTAPVFDDPHAVKQQAARTAIGRNGELADLVGPALFFASNASNYVTGQTLFVDGGYTAK